LGTFFAGVVVGGGNLWKNAADGSFEARTKVIENVEICAGWGDFVADLGAGEGFLL
jgi:hypothetical protein